MDQRTDILRYAVQRQNSARRADSNSLVRHSENNAGFLILAAGTAFRFANLQKACGSIGTHTCKQYTRAELAGVPGNRVEEHIYRRAMSIHWIALVDHQMETRGIGTYFHVKVARGHIGGGAFEGFAVSGLFNINDA